MSVDECLSEYISLYVLLHKLMFLFLFYKRKTSVRPELGRDVEDIIFDIMLIFFVSA